MVDRESAPAEDGISQPSIHGTFVTLTQLKREDIPDLYQNFGLPHADSVFQYLLWDTPQSEEAMWEKLKPKSGTTHFAIKATSGRFNPHDSHVTETNVTSASRCNSLGILSYQVYDLPNRSVEVGAIFAPSLQRSVAATEATYLHLRRAFETMGLHRVAWKLNALNERSRKAAERMGFVYEGTVRKGRFVKGGWVSSTWMGMLDEEWPGVKAGFEAWLSVENFDKEGRQYNKLEDMRHRKAQD